MFKDIFQKYNRLIGIVAGIILGIPLIIPLISNAVVVTSPPRAIQTGDITSSTILDDTIIDADVSNTTTFTFAGIQIGTSTPSSKLTIWSATTTTEDLIIISNSASTTLFSVNNNGTVYSSGNVGIGTTSPGAILSVNGRTLLNGTTTITSGILTIPNGKESAPSLTGTSNIDTGIYFVTSQIRLSVDGITRHNFTGNAAYLGGSTGYISVTDNDDTRIYRDAGNVLALKNGTNNQTLNIYATTTDASNYERLSIDTSGNVISFNSQKLGYGTARPFNFVGENVGIGTSSPYARLSVAGGIVGGYFTATSTTASSTMENLVINGNASTTNLTVSGTCTNCINTTSTSTSAIGPNTGEGSKTLTLTCDPGEKVTGGGWTQSTFSENMEVSSSRPSGDNAWQVTWQNENAGNYTGVTLTVHAICVK